MALALDVEEESVLDGGGTDEVMDEFPLGCVLALLNDSLVFDLGDLIVLEKLFGWLQDLLFGEDFSLHMTG